MLAQSCSFVIWPLSLSDKDINPIAYSTVLGAVAAELEAATIPVVDDLAKVVEPPDIIHGQHHHETMTAALHFPRESCHLCVSRLDTVGGEAPTISVHSQICCRRRSVPRAPPDDGRDKAGSGLHHIYNFADLDRFLPRQPLARRNLATPWFSATTPLALTTLYATRAGLSASSGSTLSVLVRADLLPPRKRSRSNTISFSRRGERQLKRS